MYCNGKLLFCDYIFNGYGTDKTDFLKQIELCKQAVVKKQFLPFDFKFKLVTIWAKFLAIKPKKVFFLKEKKL